MSLQLLDSSDWKLAAYGGFSREDNIVVHETRSLLYAVRYAQSSYPLGHLILSDNLTMPSVMRQIIASGFRAGFVLSFRWIPSELNYSGKGRRLFDRDYDPCKSLLHVFAQRLTQSSPARTCD